MKLIDTPIPDLKIIEPAVFGDERGWFMESWNEDKFKALGLDYSFAQDNHSMSVKNTLRGLHFQTEPGQAKLVRCTQGSVWDVAVDIRPDSPTFKQWHGIELSAENHLIYMIPLGFAHGFCVLTETAEFVYKCSSVYNGETEAGIAWNDPEIAVDWPVKEPLLSERDQRCPTLAELLKSL